MNKTEAYIKASRFYLTYELPSDLFELNEQEVTDFIQESKWQPLEDWSTSSIWDCIESLAIEFLEVSNQPTNNPKTYE
tara:strand:- start:82 stop:315 length:234 start_codon:yes stop_codon:yes gene_type:complete